MTFFQVINSITYQFLLDDRHISIIIFNPMIEASIILNLPEQPYRKYQHKLVQTYTIFAVLCCLSFSLLISEVTSIKVRHQTIFIAIAAIFAIINNRKQQLGGNRTFKGFNLLTWIVFGICGVIAMRLPYYSVIPAIIMVISGLFMTICVVKVLIFETRYCFLPCVFFILYLGAIVTPACYFLMDEGKANLKLRYLIFYLLLSTISVSILLWKQNGLLLDWYLNSKTRNQLTLEHIFTQNYRSYQFGLMKIIVLIILGHLMVYFSRTQLRQIMFIYMLIGILVVTLIVTVSLWLFQDEIIVRMIKPPTSHMSVVLRLNSRLFIFNLPRVMQRYQQQHEYERQECLFCQKQALIISYNCGHLLTCLKCFRQQKKSHIFCAMCGKTVSRVFKLLSSKFVLFGYKRKKLFIEIKKDENKYEVQEI